MQVEVVLPHRCIVGEGPFWDAKRNTICWVDSIRGEIHEYATASKQHNIIPVGQMIGSAVICADGNFLAALAGGIGYVDRESGEVALVASPESDLPGNRFNDGKCGPDGKFWAGTMSHVYEPEMGNFYVFDQNHNISRKMTKIGISNGMAWSLDHRRFYYIDTLAHNVVAYDYDKNTSEITNKRVVIDIPKEDGYPDGMTMDTEGMLWIAHWGGWQVTRWNPDTGEKLLSIPFPVSRVSCCTFGGENLEDLYVTTASRELTDEELAEQPLSGSLFVVKNIGFKGLPLFEFGTGTAD